MDELEIRCWLKNNTKLMPGETFTALEQEHIVMCMNHLLKWYYEDYPIGGFLTAVVRNDLRGACSRADDVNKRALYLYALFLANRLPSDYVRKVDK